MPGINQENLNLRHYIEPMNIRFIPALVVLLFSCAVLPAENASSIRLNQEGGTVKAVITVDGYAPEGIKFVWSKSMDPTYPPRQGDRAEFRSLHDAMEFTPTAFDGPGEYWVRAGWYDGNGIAFYSDPIQVNLDGTGGISRGDGMSVRISVNGQTASAGITYKDEMPDGVKIVWSKNPDPVYPSRDGDRAEYHGRGDSMETWLEAFDGPGTYYVRAGWYSGGKILFYSTTLEVELR